MATTTLVVPEITDQTPLVIGTKLSSNVTLDMVTHREQLPTRKHYLDATIGSPFPDVPPLMTQQMNYPEESIVNWKIAHNLQNVAQNCIEPLHDEFGEELRIQRGYSHPRIALKFSNDNPRNAASINKHFTGEAVDIYTKSFQGNMYHLAKDISKMVTGKHVEIGLIFSNRSWIHIGINGKHGPNVGDKGNPIIYTLDMIRMEIYSGFYPAVGLYINT